MPTDLGKSEPDKERLPVGAENFRHKDLNSRHLKNQAEANRKLLEIRNSDFKWRVDNRGKFGWVIMLILISQHIFLFSFIGIAYNHGCLSDIQWLIGSFFLGLMTQTYFTVNLLVRWLFSEIPYH